MAAVIRRLSLAEQANCRSLAQQRVRAAGLDWLIVASPENVFYLTGMVYEPLERPHLLLVPPTGATVLLVPRLERPHLANLPHVDRVESYYECPAPPGRRWHDLLRELVAGASHLGVESSLAGQIRQELAAFQVSDVSIVEDLRAVKSTGELDLIRHAARYADFGVERLLASAHDGAMVAEGFAETRTVMRRMMREVHDWEPLTTRVLMAPWPAPFSAQPHSIPRLHQRLGAGPHVALALTSVHGYAAESERTFFTQRPTAKEQRAFDVMMDARRLAFERIRPGARCGDLDAEVVSFLQREGYGDALLHRTGHGLGVAKHAEAPWLAEGSDDVFAAGMVVSVEPGIYLPGIGGIRHSDTVVVTDGGFETLTHAPTKLSDLIRTRCRLSQRIKGGLARRSLGLSSR